MFGIFSWDLAPPPTRQNFLATPLYSSSIIALIKKKKKKLKISNGTRVLLFPFCTSDVRGVHPVHVIRRRRRTIGLTRSNDFPCLRRQVIERLSTNGFRSVRGSVRAPYTVHCIVHIIVLRPYELISSGATRPRGYTRPRRNGLGRNPKW